VITEQHLGLISSIYDLPLERECWREGLDTFARTMNASGGTLIVLDPLYSEIQVQEYSANYQDMKNSSGVLLVEEYNAEFAKYDQPSAFRLLGSPDRGFVSEFELSGISSMDEYLNHPPVKWNREFLNITHRAASRLNVHSIWSDAITLHFSSNRGEITEHEKETGAFFLDHFAKAVELGRSFGVLKSRFDGVLSALDRFHIGIFVLSPNGSVVVKNVEADRILDAGDGVSLTRDVRMQASDDVERGQLNDAIARAVSTACAEDNKAETRMTLTRRSEAEPYMVEVMPMRDRNEMESPFRGALVFVIDPVKTDVVSAEGLQQIYGLSKSESEVCKLLAEGLETDEIADARNFSLETVRSYVKQVLQKTGVNNRAQLVRRALNVNLPIDPPSTND